MTPSTKKLSSICSVAYLFLLSGLTLLAPARACLNDRDTDTLAEEAKALPGMVEVIIGRFERNPTLYYEMRIKRITGELKANPAQLPLYDDIAVAYDRIGKDDDALAWMARKRLHLANTTPENNTVHEAWYRYYANIGTFRVHRWLHNGADRELIAEVKQARAEIARAIAIKPDAHFGREVYQLQVMDWIIAQGRVKGEGEPQELAYYIQPVPQHPVAEGLAGLIVLGNAWESVDVFNALTYYLGETDGTHKLGFMALRRSWELIDSGHGSLLNIPRTTDPSDVAKSNSKERLEERAGNMFHLVMRGPERIDGKYETLRAEAEQWQTARTSYMMLRLKAGHHPDTDQTFWKDWHPKRAPSLSTGFWYEFQGKYLTAEFRAAATVTVFLSAIAGIVFLIIRRMVRSRRQRTA